MFIGCHEYWQAKAPGLAKDQPIIKLFFRQITLPDQAVGKFLRAAVLNRG
jgi:phage tail protein X